MWDHRHLDQLSGDGRAELDDVSPLAIVATAVMWCVCVVVGGVVRDDGPECLPLAGDLWDSVVWGPCLAICVMVVGDPVWKFLLGLIRGWGLMGLGSEFIGGLGLIHPVAAQVGGLV
ncbi:hypothetical protein CHARACLAT_027273 [Characodon lateralis]|uniref:Uncharacterized protein n=1 Tax=Characodon lateralis TaxID=208331 RepID=A0ABU7D1S8_9TELE|nr:hypothetical protein [Characodon lateralis]